MHRFILSGELLPRTRLRPVRIWDLVLDSPLSRLGERDRILKQIIATVTFPLNAAARDSIDRLFPMVDRIRIYR